MKCRLSGLLIVAALLMPAAAWAFPAPVNPYTPLTNAPAWEFTSVGVTLNNTIGYTFGEIFTPTADINVNFLGYFYDSATGMTESHNVGLYDASGNLLDSTTITSGSSTCSPSDAAPVPCDSTSPHFLYNPTTTVELLAGQTYVLEGTSGVQDPYAWNDSGFTVLWPLTIDGINYLSNGGFTLSFNGTTPNDSDEDGSWGPDMGFETPEPSSFLLLGSGLAGLAGFIKRKLAAS